MKVVPVIKWQTNTYTIKVYFVYVHICQHTSMRTVEPVFFSLRPIKCLCPFFFLQLSYDTHSSVCKCGRLLLQSLLFCCSISSVSFSTVKQRSRPVLPLCGKTDQCKTKSMCMCDLHVQYAHYILVKRLCITHTSCFNPKIPIKLNVQNWNIA